MSESDDSDILADLRALDEVLCSNVDILNETVHSRSIHTLTNSDDFVDISENDYIESNQDVDKFQDVYEINEKLITGYKIIKQKLTVVMQDCEQKIEQLNEKIKAYANISNGRSRLLLTTAGMPYFKDKNYFCAPKNQDTKIKETRGELSLFNMMKKPCRWSAKDRATLLNAIYKQAFDLTLTGSNNEINEKTSEWADVAESSRATKVKSVLPENFVQMVGTLGEKEFDWHKIAVTNFDKKHSPSECRCMWNVYLHPDIRKSEWTSAEDKQLLQYVKENRYQDWDTITKRLGTKRSAYQCFIRYNTIKKSPYSRRPWNKQEDEQLERVINRLKIGNYIPWAEVASYLYQRTKQQVYIRWNYRKAPHLRKGRFSRMETQMLQKAIRKYGQNFRMISKKVLPQRTAIQLCNHYETLSSRKERNVWTFRDDTKLLQLNNKLGNDWCKIATYFTSKSRTQVRHRHMALQKYLKKGNTLENMSRGHALAKDKNVNVLPSLDKDDRNVVCLPSEISSRLYDILCFPPLIIGRNVEELYDIQQLTYNTRYLYSVLKLLDVKINITEDVINYTHLNKRERQVLISIKNYTNRSYNFSENNEIEEVEEFRSRMFGPIPNIDENFRFIPPLPFDGYIKRKIVKNATSIDCNLNVSNKFLIEMSMELVTPDDISFLVDDEEKAQFRKLTQLLISDSCDSDSDKENANSCKLPKRQFSSNIKATQSPSDVRDESSLKAAQLHELPGGSDANEYNKKPFNDVIFPNHATLLGLKNLYLWKLLYEYKNEPNLMSQSIQQARRMKNPKYRKAYETLRTRLLQLFKFPISLSTTMIQVHDSKNIFSLDDKDGRKSKSTKRKSKNNRKLQNKRAMLDIQDTNVQTIDNSVVSDNNEVICKK